MDNPSLCGKYKVLVIRLCPILATPWTVTHQALLSMGFSGQEHLIGLPCPSSWDLPNPGIEPACIIPPTLAGVFFTTAATQMQVQMQLLISRSCLVSKRLLDGVDDVGTGLWPLLSHQGCGCVSESATEVYISSSPSHLCIKF